MKLHAFIFCWPGQVDKARDIYRAVRPHVDALNVIDSSGEAGEDVPEGWIGVDRAFFYGRLFRTALEHFTGDVLLQIQADASSDDWGTLVRTCRKRHESYWRLGIWAPDIDHTYWKTPLVRAYELPGTGLVGVWQTDGIVSSLTKDIVAFLKQLDYERNNLGWGIDWAAIAYACANGRLVLRDTTVKVLHPKGSGYDHKDARLGQEAFLAQLPVPVAVQCALLMRAHPAMRVNWAFPDATMR